MQGKIFSWHQVLFIVIALTVHCGGASRTSSGKQREGAAKATPSSPASSAAGVSKSAGSREKAAAIKPPEKLFLWQITSPATPEKSIYLLGSVHVGNPSFYPLDSTIEELYQKSDALLVEVNTVAIPLEKAMEIVLSHATLPEGQKIYNSLSSRVWNKLILALEKYKVAPETLVNMKPWFAAVTLSALRVIEKGYSVEYGIDKHFIKKGDKPVIELESIDYQFSLFDAMSPALQELLLLDAIEGTLQSGGDLEEAIGTWRKGDAAAMHHAMFKDLQKHPEFLPIHKHMITNRNYEMADAIEASLIDNNSLFVVIGAGHIVGEEGLTAIFEKKGYNVQQLAKRQSHGD